MEGEESDTARACGTVSYIIFGARVLECPLAYERVDALKEQGMRVQLFDASRINGRAHLESAIEHAERAISQGTARTRTLEMETMLYAAGERQISHAIEKVGIKQETDAVAGLAVELDEDGLARAFSQLGIKRNDDVLSPSRKKLLALGFSERELDAAGPDRANDLALELVALLDVSK